MNVIIIARSLNCQMASNIAQRSLCWKRINGSTITQQRHLFMPSLINELANSHHLFLTYMTFHNIFSFQNEDKSNKKLLCETFLIIISIMEEKQVILVNRIKVSELGITFLRQLPAELNRMKTAQDLQKQKENFSSKDIKRRGSGVDFFNFTNQTQNLIKRQKCCLFRVRGGNRSINESHHKLQLHYDNWVNQQNITKNRVSDIQSRMMQNKYSEYDWLGNRQALSLKRKEILGEWEIAQDKRRRNLQRILGHRGITEHSPN